MVDDGVDVQAQGQARFDGGVQGLLHVGCESVSHERVTGVFGDEHADAAPLFDESLVDEDGEGLADGGRVDAVGRGVLRGGGQLVPSAQGAAQDLRADVVGDLHVDRDPRDECGCHVQSLRVLRFIT